MTRQTSIDAYNQIKAGKLLTAMRLKIYEVLYEHGPLTCNEIFKIMLGTSTINQPNIHARLDELREMGCVEELGERICTVTGNTVILWSLTGFLPKKLSKAEKIISAINKTKARLAKLESKLATEVANSLQAKGYDQ